MSDPSDFGRLLVEVGSSFRRTREAHGWAVVKVVELSGLDESVVLGIESGELAPDITTLERMLKAYGFVALHSRTRRG